MDGIEKFLLKWGFINVDTTFTSQWEMFLICFVRLDLKPMVANVQSKSIAKGKFNVMGNKGGLCVSFTLGGRLFNFIGGHLIHAPKNFIKRNVMISELIQEFNLHRPQKEKVVGLEIDTLAEFAFVVGDLNYRLNSTFTEFTNKTIDPIRDFK
jgi:hypothetical protein